jgi:PEP-CTERM motif
MRITPFGKFFAFAALLFSVPAANAALFYNEEFDYSDGALTTVSGGLWTAHSGAGSTPVMVSSETISLVHGSGSREDVSRTTGSVMGAGDKWYAAFDVSVTGGSDTTYFAHFIEGSTIFESRVFVTAPAGGGNYAIGLSNTGTVTSTWASDFTFGDTHRIVVSYDYDTHVSNLWVDPVNEASTSITVNNGFTDEIAGFAFRQSAGTSVQVIDNLAVATSFNEALAGVPEPATLSLLGLAGLALAGVARRRS